MTRYTISRIVGKAVASKDILVLLFNAPDSNVSGKYLRFEGNGKRVGVVVKYCDSPKKLSKMVKKAVEVIEQWKIPPKNYRGVSPVA